MKLRLTAYLIVALSACTLISSSAFAQGTTFWPMYRHDQERIGRAEADALRDTSLSPIWVYPKPEAGVGAVDNDFGTTDEPNFTTTGLWVEGDSDQAPNAYNGNFLYADTVVTPNPFTGKPVDPTAKATWTFPLVTQSNSVVAYYVYVWFPSHAYAGEPMHATHAPYTVEIVNDDLTIASTATYAVDQSSGGNWVVLSSSAMLVRDDQFVRVTLSNEVPESDTNTIVIADAVVLTHDVGSVLASPAFAPNDNNNRDDDLVISCLTENRPLENVSVQVPATDEYGNTKFDSNGNPIMTTMTVQSGSVRVGQICGLYAEDQPGTGLVDERGTLQWWFPFNKDNWIAGGFSSSPTIATYIDQGIGTEAAYCPAKDGQIYVIDTRNTTDGLPTSPQKIIWQGPGYIGEPTAASWASVTKAGRQGADFLQKAAVAPTASESTATWDITVGEAVEYSIYAWIPPSTSALPTPAIGIPDAKYKITVGTYTFNATADQRSGGRWALLGKYEPTIDNADFEIELSNTSEVMNSPSAVDRYAFADAIKIVPSSLGIFDWSSPVVDDDGHMIYIGTTAGRLFCFEIGNPDPVWVYPAADEGAIGGIYASPTLYNGNLFIGSADGHVYKIKASNGVEEWCYPKKPTSSTESYEILGEISSSVVVKDDIVYVAIGSDINLPPIMDMAAGMTGRVIALQDKGTNLRDGTDVTLKWQYPAAGEEALGSFLYSSPLLFNDNSLAIGSSDGTLLGLDPAADGAVIPGWTDGFPDLGEAIYSSAAGVMVNKLGVLIPMAYVGTQGGSLKSVDLRYGTSGWSYGLTGAVTSSPALAEDRLYVGDMSGLTWAFSSRAGNGSDGRENWNYNRLPDGPPGNATEGTNGKESRIEVDIFRREEWQALKNGMALPNAVITDPDLHKIARAQKDGNTSDQPGHNHHPAFPYEWGETVYVIAWNCFDPNDPNDPNATWVKGSSPGSKYNDDTDSTVRLTIKSRGPGDQSDQSTALTMTEKGSFMDKDGNVIYYTKYAYVLGTSSSSSTQAPGSRITLSVQELPSTKTDSVNKGSSAGDCIVPEHISTTDPILPTKPADPADPSLGDVYDHAKYEPQRIAINNPLGLVYTDESGVTTLIAVDAGWNTDRAATNPNSLVHVNDNRGNTPSVRAGLVAHGTNSDERIVFACDRSLLSLTGTRLSKFRMEREDLGWNGGPDLIWSTGPVSAKVPTWLAWEQLPPITGPNSSLDYPDIRMRQVGFTMAESRLDPTQESTDLRPGGALVLPATDATWPVGRTPVAQVISVPKYQPANMPSTWPANTAVLQATGYTGHSYIFIDSNGDGRLNRSGSLGSSQQYQQSVTGARSEAYRRFHSQVHVPPDYRVDVAQKTFDIGAVPHGFGLTPTGVAQSRPFYATLGENVKLDLPVGPTNPADPSLDAHFKSFTAYHEGNVNILNLRMAKTISPSTGYTYGLDLFSDTAEGNAYFAGGRWHAYGAFVPAEGITSALDRQFVTADPGNMPPVAGKGTRTFHKPRVGDAATVLRLPDLPTRLWRDTATYGYDPSRVDSITGEPSPLIPSLPFFSVAVPVGVPVGTYSRAVTLFEDSNGNDIFDPGESVGNPLMDVKVTVTENRLTDGFMPGTMPQLDPNAGAPGTPQPPMRGDVSPAAYMDRNWNLHMFWSSSRYNGVGTAGDPWYLYTTVLPWSVGDWALKPTYLNGFWSMAQPDPGTAQWWTSIVTSFPTPAPGPLATFFNGGPGTVLLNSVKFSSPSVATTANGENWLFFGGEAIRHRPATGNSPEIKDHEYKAFYWLLDNAGNPQATALSSSRDWTMPKYGIRGAASTIGGRSTLWTFWYGGNNSQWRIYYNMSPLNSTGTVGDPASWSNDARLPLPRGLVSAAEPSIVPRTTFSRSGNPRQVLDVIYSAYSQYHKNADIYLSRYEPDLGQVSNGAVDMDTVTLPEVRDEVLVRDPSSAIYSSKHVDWEPDADEFEVWVSGPGFAAPLRINMDPSNHAYTYTRDSQTRSLIFTYTGTASGEQQLKMLFRSVVVSPEAGTVKFLRDPGRDAVVTTTYRPRAYRLTTDGGADTGPCTLFDDSMNPRYRLYPSSFWTPGSYNGSYPTDRLWVLWRRPATALKGTGVVYKSFRYTMRLNDQIAKDAFDDISFQKDPSSSTAPSEPAGPVEIDWAKKRLYFTAIDDGKTFVVKYPNAMGTDVTEILTVQMDEELDAHGNAFGNLTSEVSNEGQVCVVRDPDAYVSKLWVFWTSTRAGNTDVYYETISPRFYAREQQ